MSLRRTLATAARVLTQLRADHRTVALILVVPCVLVGLLAWIYDGTAMFDRVGPLLLGLFPFVLMFVVTSVTTLRERTSGTLERLLTTPLAKADLLTGYALAFGLMALLQGIVATTFAVVVCGLDVAGPLWVLIGLVVLTAVLGTALGLLASAFAATEFQAVQLMPALVLPQALLCGLLVPRESMPRPLELLSDVLPLSYAVDAAAAVAGQAEPWDDLTTPVLVMLAWIVLSLAVGSLTLRRRTP